MFFNNSFYIASDGAPINCSFKHLLFFFFRLFYLSPQFLFVLILESSVIYWLANVFSSFWLFFVFSRMLWMLVTVNVANKNSRNNLYGNIFWYVQEMSQILKRWLKHFWQSVQKKKKRMAIAKRFCITSRRDEFSQKNDKNKFYMYCFRAAITNPESCRFLHFQNRICLISNCLAVVCVQTS